MGQYLSDQGINFFQETKSSNNGRVDFVSNKSDYSNKSDKNSDINFIIETKQVDLFSSKKIEGLSQLNQYLQDYPNIQVGYLVVYISKGETAKEYTTSQEFKLNNGKTLIVKLIDLRERPNRNKPSANSLPINLDEQIKSSVRPLSVSVLAAL